MPQKTKKEKMAISARREYKLREVKPAEETVVEVARPTDYGYALTPEDLEINKYFRIDLRRSLVLITIIFTLEFLLYYATINNYFRFY